MTIRILFVLLFALPLFACGDDDADALGIGAACTSTDQCAEGQQCLTAFKGGYCGMQGCVQSSDCPENSVCVVHENGTNYCFRSCVDKPDCNANRAVEVESNCVSSVTFASGSKDEGKVCEPPSNT